MSFRRDENAFWQVILGGIITIGGVFLAVGFAFGIETVKATDGNDIIRFGSLFWNYLITGSVLILVGMFFASVRFLGRPWTPSTN